MKFSQNILKLCILALLIASSSSAQLGNARPTALAPFVPGELLVKFHPAAFGSKGQALPALAGPTLTALNTYGLLATTPLFPQHATSDQGLDRIMKLSFAADANVLAIAEQLTADPLVEYIEPNYIYLLDDPGVALATQTPPQHESAAHLQTTSPNDPFYAEQYGLENTGQNGGTVDADIDAPEGWSISTGAPTVLIAVLDSGIDYTHEDLSDGRVRTDIDRDFVNDDDDARDDFGHGTHVAGIIAAQTNNGIGIAGVMQQAQLLPLKVCDDQGRCTAEHIATALQYAMEQNARVINLSFSGLCSGIILDAIMDTGAVIVAAAGNNEAAVNFPAALPTVIAVGATDKRDLLATFSGRGAQQELVAPGVDIWSTVPGNSYRELSGTSMAAPFVSGVVGILLAQRPELTNDQVRAILRTAADDLGAPGFDPQYGYGRVNLFTALNTATPATTPPVPELAVCPYCAAVGVAYDVADSASLLTNIRTLRDTIFQQDPGRRWAQIYYAHQFEVAFLVATDLSLSSEVLAGWREFDPVFVRLMDEQAPPVILTPELVATAHRVMMGVAAQSSPEVAAVIESEWARVDPDRFIGWEVRESWAQLVRENAPAEQIYLPLLVR
jgi:subtilisin family serine protease